MRSLLLEPLHPATGVLAKTRFQILVLPECPQHESYAFGVGTREQQYPVGGSRGGAAAPGASLRRTRSSRFAGHLAAERPGQSPDRVLDRRRSRGTFVGEQRRDVDVALAARGAACPASVQPGETHRGVAAQGACEAVAEAFFVVVAGGQIHVIVRSDASSVPRPELGRGENMRRPARPQRGSGRHRDWRQYRAPWMFATSLPHCRGGATRIQPRSTGAAIGEQCDIKSDILEKCQSHSHDSPSTRISTSITCPSSCPRSSKEPASGTALFDAPSRHLARHRSGQQ